MVQPCARHSPSRRSGRKLAQSVEWKGTMKRALLLIGMLPSLLRTGKAPVNQRCMERLAMFLLCLFVSSQTWSQVQVKDYPHAKSSDWFKTYIRGVGIGINVASIRPDRLALYCPPLTFTPDANEFIAILDREIIDESMKPGGLKDDTPIELLLLRGLLQKFPCKKRHDTIIRP